MHVKKIDLITGLTATALTWLPIIQGVLGVFISLVILLIYLEKYKKAKKDNEK